MSTMSLRHSLSTNSAGILMSAFRPMTAVGPSSVPRPSPGAGTPSAGERNAGGTEPATRGSRAMPWVMRYWNTWSQSVLDMSAHARLEALASGERPPHHALEDSWHRCCDPRSRSLQELWLTTAWMPERQPFVLLHGVRALHADGYEVAEYAHLNVVAQLVVRVRVKRWVLNGDALDDLPLEFLPEFE